ncbi:hypothetical protein PTSG_06664 [Salpingoeca rosetta]|uniref:Globin domain-containing protein n=1 Tax=Salpingoeca rosetta (strain ATCC 50818 / BSB-021) TaxID=946362 RepID=F2UFM8_SALR5|nr:uncharacterized protein PTSG_06664 [Salpingoeca rosetta]EGD75597.1 hypothetical protein PTSG_06664 [Salpingoeca rosetta]|eukprot:XP_004992054.1 hypothetical protein PTSG_06664 [Salpingoeca rosetta]
MHATATTPSARPARALIHAASADKASDSTAKMPGQQVLVREQGGQGRPHFVPHDEMRLDMEQLKIALGSWTAVVELVPTWHEVFFAELFQAHPETERLLYSSDKSKSWNERHMARVGKSVGDVIKSLSNYDDVIEHLTALGTRHARYGLHVDQLDLFINAFLWTLGAGLGDSWDHSVKKAWMHVLPFILSPLKSGLVVARTLRNDYNTSGCLRCRRLLIPLHGRRLRPITVSLV